MKIVKQKFGMLSDGTKVNLFTVKNDKMSFSCTDYGCTLTSIVINKDDGTKTDVLLGFSTLEGYLNTKFCFGLDWLCYFIYTIYCFCYKTL